MTLQKSQILLVLGMLLLSLGILLGRFAPGIGWTDFLAGVCIGLSMVFNVVYLIKAARQRRESR